MPALILYLLKVNVALVLFYLAYHVALRRLTFYHLNRLFLVFGILFSTVYPFIDLSELFADNEKITNTYMATMPTWVLTAQTAAPTPEAFDLWQVPVYLFWAGVAVMLVRFILQFISLYKIHAVSEPAKHKSIGFRQVESINQAFSFWQTIYINPAKHKSEELESILRHELIHITGWHTLDVMLAELSTVFYWFNPGAWLMKKAVKENLEFIADQNVVNTGVDKKEYQYLLLKVVGATQPQIANQFNFPSLKRRIAMMNKMPTSKAGKLRLLIALPLTATLLFAFQNVAPVTEAITSIESEIIQQGGNNPKIEKLITQLKQNRDLKSVRSKKIDGKEAIVISLKGGGTEVYFVSDAKSLAELERKYVLPELSPPPAPAKEELPPPPPPAPEAPELPPPPPPVKQESRLDLNLPDGVTYYIDGKEDKLGNYKELNPTHIYSINVFKDGSAEEVFGKKAANGVISIITEKNKGSKQVQEFQQKYPALPAPPPPVKGINKSVNKTFFEQNPDVSSMFWTTIGETGKEQKVTGFVLKLKNGATEHYEYSDQNSIDSYKKKYGDLPVVPESLQLPPPPPPVRHNGPLLPGTGAKLVEDEKTITYVLWPGETTRREFDVAKNAFRESGFDLNFDQKYDGDKLIGIKITLKSDRKGSNANAVYNTSNLDGLKESNNVIIVKANKQTGELIVGSTIAEK